MAGEQLIQSDLFSWIINYIVIIPDIWGPNLIDSFTCITHSLES